ncbi:MOSC domain-containing protein [Spirosoma rhododendri]|uniref:MOSC domain-containing protein n=1 Tax=Spirosoma rhododendri TaxID=2728024 RepID=A0A7L5DL53_9BACT|nr:MOSC N-terminal beta barrel domain-containing protein [Spirosoma rhododendri]QJD77148.1 MOSC domain-containing protein [Spirosoma rhododendri]
MFLSALYIYPIKSLGGISVDEAVVEAKGLRHDRRFMLVTPDGKFITQRTHPIMALIDVRIDGDTLSVWHRHRADDVLNLPLDGAVPGTGETMAVSIWDSKDVPAQTVSAEADAWFSRVLAMPCRLVYMPDTTHRPVDEQYARQNDPVSFADGYPYLLIGQSSLDYLNRLVISETQPEPMEMARFRPNLVVSGSKPYEEDGWATFRIGDLTFYGVKPCARCVLTTIDPTTAEKGREPLRTLATYRQYTHKILFGQNVLPDPDASGVLRVGQVLDVTVRQEPWLAPPVDMEY